MSVKKLLNARKKQNKPITNSEKRVRGNGCHGPFSLLSAGIDWL
jgi:hypothetical protein